MSGTTTRHWVTTGLAVFLIGLLGLASCGDGEKPAPRPTPAPAAAVPGPPASGQPATFAGSAGCRSCHERFYELWAPSHHGTAMRPWSKALAEEIAPQAEPIEVDGVRFQADVAAGVVRASSDDGTTTGHPIEHVMGGKNVYFLLTPRERGRLQVLPVAYDVREKRWYDTTGSMVRHATGHTDRPVPWTDPLLTFNTACWNCHVSQLSVNYDAATDSYASTWAEPGINCETCHGPASEHVRVCEEAAGGPAPEDLKILRITAFTHEQRNDTCAPCHAKAVPLTEAFGPSARYFDHFDLVCLEDLDFHPDGRDLGENYTFTGWRMSPCAISGQLDCVHCHTSSGRTRFLGERSNEACLPCHEDKVATVAAHSRHPAGSEGSRCVSCHMPMTEFARMRRSDHSMRPPMPALTVRFGSPNACNLCHADRDAAWADAHVRAWHEDDYQAPVLHQAELVDAARRADWTRLAEMIEAVVAEDRDEVVATSLLRLLRRCPDPRIIPALGHALVADPSPLVRSAAAAGLEGVQVPQVVRALFAATADELRLVRIRAAGALAGLSPGGLPQAQAAQLAKANAELEAALAVRPDTWSSHYNLGNLYEQRGKLDEAMAAYERAIRLRPDVVQPHVNLAMIHARRGHNGRAENALRRALEIDEGAAAVHYNLGLLLAETGRVDDAKQHLERALALDPTLAGAAYNLGLLTVDQDLSKALDYLRRAAASGPNQPRFAWAYAYHLGKAGRPREAVQALAAALDRGTVSADVYRLLVLFYREQGEDRAARAVLRRAASDLRLSEADRRAFAREAE